MTKIFVGTMYCGEGDITKCCEQILKQRDVEIEHLVIQNLSEKDAHNTLWSAWRERKNTFDLFVKVDADTVLSHEFVISNVAEIMKNNPRITGIQAPLQDYFTDDFINGLNCFSNRVTFLDTVDDLFCDRRVDVDHDIILGSDKVPDVLRPAGYHCYHSSEIQAFHFGVHRMLKRQHHTITKVRNAWCKNGRDKLRGLALMGARLATNFVSTRKFNYTDPELFEQFIIASDSYELIKGEL